MYSVDTAGRTKMKRLWKYVRCRSFDETELKKVSAHSGCRWSSEQSDEMALDLRPEFVVAPGVGPAEAEIALDALDGLRDAPVVEVDAITPDVSDREPVAGLEMPLGGARAVAEQRVVAVEALEDDPGDLPWRCLGTVQVGGLIELVAHRGRSLPGAA